MPTVRAPWWMYVVAASFLVFLGLTFYLVFLGTEPPGIQAVFTARGVLVRAVLPGSAAEQAGLQPGDIVVAVDGQALRGQGDWIGIVANLEAGRVSQWQVERGGQRLPVALTPARVSLRHWTSERQLSTVLAFGRGVVTLLLAFLIAFSRPYDPVARLGAWLVAVMAIGAEAPPIGSAVAWRGLPLPLAALVFIPGTSLPMAGPILLTFFADFPRKLFRARWPWVLVWVPAALIGTFVCVYFYCMVYRPQLLTALPPWGPIVMVGNNVACALAGLAALVLNYRRLEDVNERRRVRLIVAGAIVTWLPALWLIVAFYFAPGARYSPILAATNFLTLVSPLSGLAFPLALAHAILRHRLFDIRVMVRQGLQYALARRAVMSAASAVAVVLLLDLLLHKDQPPASVLRARGWFYFVLGGLALFARMRRQVWLDALDRHFFRERCDAQRLLREVVEEIRQAGSLERVAPLVTARVEAALHPEFAAILVREPRERYFRTLSCAPAGQAPPPLSSDGKLVAFLRVLDKPLEITLSDTNWLRQQLPPAEIDLIRQSRTEWLVPIAMVPEQTEGMLALGPKRSEEPYSREDQDLLAAIAASLSLLAQKPAVSVRASLAFEECPKCGACYDSSAERCEREGTALVPVRLPRLLAGRYHIEKRLGRGGMGAVYEATDTALERKVAVKVLRDELIGSNDAAERFRREARVAASFSHNNVVTIHDFGVVADTRAFLVMERLQGLTLRQELIARKRLPAARTLGVLSGVCAALEAAHRRGLIHRDLKPENIFLIEGETPDLAKVLDFGLAKMLPSTSTQATIDTSPGTLLGTLPYMSPEQLRGQPAKPGSDLWALSVVAYEMLAGALPFSLAAAADWQVAVLAGQFTPLARHLPEAPPLWENFFQRAFAQDQAQRPVSAARFFSELERVLA